jgi:hypothetical protein
MGRVATALGRSPLPWREYAPLPICNGVRHATRRVCSDRFIEITASAGEITPLSSMHEVAARTASLPPRGGFPENPGDNSGDRIERLPGERSLYFTEKVRREPTADKVASGDGRDDLATPGRTGTHLAGTVDSLLGCCGVTPQLAHILRHSQ